MWVDRAWLHPVLSNTLEFAVEEASSNQLQASVSLGAWTGPVCPEIWAAVDFVSYEKDFWVHSSF